MAAAGEGHRRLTGFHGRSMVTARGKEKGKNSLTTDALPP
jgi:hypothetical protein